MIYLIKIFLVGLLLVLTHMQHTFMNNTVFNNGQSSGGYPIPCSGIHQVLQRMDSMFEMQPLLMVISVAGM